MGMGGNSNIFKIEDMVSQNFLQFFCEIFVKCGRL